MQSIDDYIIQQNLKQLAWQLINFQVARQDKPDSKEFKISININLLHSCFNAYYNHPFLLKDQPLEHVLFLEFLEPLNKQVYGKINTRRNVHPD